MLHVRESIRGAMSVSDDLAYTVDHEEIKRWGERRGGRPAALGRLGRRIAGRRVDFPEYRIKAALRPISWEGFFRAFEASRWGFVYQQEAASAQLSRFYRFVERDRRAAVAASAGRTPHPERPSDSSPLQW